MFLLTADPTEIWRESSRPDFTQPSPASAPLEARIAAILSHEIAFIMHDSFRTGGAEQAAHDALDFARLVETGSAEAPLAPGKKLPGLSALYQRMCATPLLEARMEQVCFRHMNWHKYRANVLRAKLAPQGVAGEEVFEIESHLREADRIRNYILQANCRLVMSIVKKFSESRDHFEELVSESLLTLAGAAEKFDISRGFRFSTYATRSIQRRLYRFLTQRQKQRRRFLNNSDENLTATVAEREFDLDSEATLDSVALEALLAKLDRRERLIVEARFGLRNLGKKQTFLEIGNRLKISKERVRQLAERALLKLRGMTEELSV